MILTNIPISHWVNLRKLGKDSVVVDAGAYMGEFSDGLRRYKDCRIISIEPTKTSIEILKTKNLEVIEKALVGRDYPKEMTLYCFRKDTGNTLHPIKRDYPERYQVETITLDDLFKLCKRINFLKCDIEGAEKNLINTMTQEDADKIDQISMEFHYSLQKPLLRKLRKLGYKMLQFNYREYYFYR